MDRHTENKALFKRFFEALGSGDGATLDELFAPHAKAIAMGTSVFSGTRDRDEVVQTAQALKQMAPAGVRFDVKSMVAEGERVVAEVQGEALLHTGTTYNNQYCFIASFTDGRITELKEYFCTKLADAALVPALPPSNAA